MREIWTEENDRTFYGKLPRPRLYLAKLDNDWFGYCEICDDFHKIVLHFDGKFRWTKAMIREILIHEMIHQYQAIQKSARTRKEIHGSFFQYHHIRIFGVRYSV